MVVSWCRMLCSILADDSGSDAPATGAFRLPGETNRGFSHGRTTNHLTRHVSIDLMPQSRHKKERFLPKGDECEP